MIQRILSFILITISNVALAQTGNISGVIKDKATDQVLPGAYAIIPGLQQGTTSDLDGKFEIRNLKPGSYTLVISFLSYSPDSIRNVQVVAGKTTIVNSAISELQAELKEVVISGLRLNDNDISLIADVRKNDLISAGITAQQISLSQDRDAAQVIKRIPGVTIVNNRFVNIRGLSERYSTVTLNGIIAPSSEVDSKAFAFDLIPSSMIDRMMVFKSASAELPVEFAGAVINVESKGATDENSLSVNISTGIRIGTTFRNFFSYKGSDTDIIGFDGGSRQLPSYFPTYNLRTTTTSDNTTTISRGLPNNWAVYTHNALPDYRMNINFSRNGSIRGKQLSNITSLNYSNNRQHIQQVNYYYDTYIENASYRRYRYNDIRDSENIRVGLVSNFILQLNDFNQIQFRNLFSQQGTSQTTLRSGVEDIQGVDVNNRALNYQSRSIYSGQLAGKHTPSPRLGLDWILGYSMTYADQPDYRRIRSQRPTGTKDLFAIQVPPNASTLDAGRFYSKLIENAFSHALNTEYLLNPGAKEESQGKITAGYYLSLTNRNFNARWFSYKWNSITNRPQTILTNSTFENLFNEQNVGAYDGDGRPPYFVLEEGTNFSDKYSGQNVLTAGYANITMPLGNFRLSTGVRFEYNRQQLNSFQTDGTRVNVDNPVTSILPSGNLAYHISENSLLRAAYGKTVNRPVLRELAPFNFYDFDRNANFYGNPDLITSNIHNIDFRWENYPSKNESVTLGAFFKHFNSPIELILTGGSNLLYTYKNAKSARTLGVEAEVRKSLAEITTSGFIDKISILFNAAIIESEVDMGKIANQARRRSMQGQSPYIFNTALYYSDVERGWQINLSHNIFGPRIYAVGDDLNATQFELPRHQLDLTISKEFASRWEAKAGIQDVLNRAVRIQQDTDGDMSLAGKRDAIQTFSPGQYISLGLTYKL